ncbi:hypothetical protein [Paenibacillus agricola]|nr:hypothetical protein [Paenibacillus agricola]
MKFTSGVFASLSAVALYNGHLTVTVLSAAFALFLAIVPREGGAR